MLPLLHFPLNRLLGSDQTESRQVNYSLVSASEREKGFLFIQGILNCNTITFPIPLDGAMNCLLSLTYDRAFLV